MVLSVSLVFPCFSFRPEGGLIKAGVGVPVEEPACSVEASWEFPMVPLVMGLSVLSLPKSCLG